MYNANGSAEKELNAYLDSVEGKMTQLQNKIQQLATITIDSEWLKDLIDAASLGIEVFSKLIEKANGLGPIIGAATGIFAQIKGFGITKIDKDGNFGLGSLGNLFAIGGNNFFKTFSNKDGEQAGKSFGTRILSGIRNAFKGATGTGIDANEFLGGLLKDGSEDAPLKDVLHIGEEGRATLADALGAEQASKDVIELITNMKGLDAETATVTDTMAQVAKQTSLFGSLTKTLGQVVGTLVSSVITAGLSIAVSMAISGLISLINNEIHKHENTIRAGKEAQTRTAQVREESTNIRETKNNAKERYNELRKGVFMDRNVIKNISLSAEEYEEFLDINQQLVDTFPQLRTGITDSGQALVDLGKNAEEATGKLDDLAESQTKINANKIKGDMPAIIRGIMEENKDIDDEIALAEEAIVDYNRIREQMEKPLTGEGVHIEFGADYEGLNEFISMLKDAEIEYKSTIEGVDIFGTAGNKAKINDVYDVFQNSINDRIFIAQDTIKSKNVEKQNKWVQGFLPDFLEILQSDPAFLRLPDGISDAITSMLHQINYDQLFDTFGSDADFNLDLRNKVIGRIERALRDGDVEDIDLANIFEFNFGDKTNREMRDEINDTLNTIFPGGEGTENFEIKQQILVALDYKYLGEDGKYHWKATDTRNALWEAIGGQFGENANGQTTHFRGTNNPGVSWAELIGITQDDLKIADEMMQLGQFDFNGESFEELLNYLHQWKEANIDVVDSAGTLEDVFNNTEFTNVSSQLESNISTLKTALDNYRESGELTSEQLEDLFKNIPSLAEYGEDITMENIGDEILKNATKFTEAFNKAMDDSNLDESAKAAAQNYLNAFWDQMATVPESAEYAKEVIRDFLVKTEEADPVSGAMRTIGKDKYDEFMDALQKKYGNDIDWSVVMSILPLIDPDGEVSDWMDEIENTKIEVKLVADLEEAKRARDKLVEGKDSEIAAERSVISARQANNERIEESDYDNIILAQATKVGRNKDYYEKASKAYEKGKHGRIADQLKKEMESAQAEWQNSLSDLYEVQKEAREANLNYLNTLLSTHEAVGAELERQKTLIEQDGLEMKKEFAQELATNRQKQIATQLAIIAENDKLYKQTGQSEYLQNSTNAKSKINDIRASGITPQEIISQSQVASLQVSMTELEQKATAVEDAITLQEGEGLKPTINQYNKLIDNGKNQIQNLEAQNQQLRNQQRALINQQGALARNSAKWREISSQIKANNSAISQMNNKLNKWKANLKSFGGDIGSSLLSSLQAAFDESISPTGLQYNTMKELAAQFEGIEGFDFADIFYNTEHGVKLDTRATKRVVDAQYGIVTSEIKSRIQEQTQELNKLKEQYNNTADAAEKLKISAKIDFAQEGLDNLYNQLSQYQAFYGEAEKLFSKFGEFSRAQQTANGGDTYNSLQSYLETQESDFEKGLVGTDDFKAYTAIFDEWGRNTLDAYIQNRDMIKRYITEDASGMQNFFNDLVAAGYASTDGNSYYSFGSTDIEEMAHAIHTNEEFMNYMFGRAQDYGFVYDYVSTQTQGELKLQELVHETAEAIIRKNELLRDGASQEAIDEEVSHIEELQERIATVKELMGEVAAKEGKITANEIATAVASIDELRSMYEATDDDQLKNVIRQMMENAAEEVGLVLKPDLQIEFPKEYEGWEQYTEIPVEVKYKYKPADEVTDEDFNEMKTNLQSGELSIDEAYISALDKISEKWKENESTAKGYFDILNEADPDLLDKVIIGNGQYEIDETYERKLEELAEMFGLTGDEAKYLLDIIRELGVVGRSGDIAHLAPMDYKKAADVTAKEWNNAMNEALAENGTGDRFEYEVADKIRGQWDGLMAEAESSAAIQKNLDVLKYADLDVLKTIDFNNLEDIDDRGLRNEADALKELATIFGLTNNEANKLVEILDKLDIAGELAGTAEANGGMFNLAGQGGTLGVDMTSLDAYLNKIQGSKIHGIDFDFDPAKLSLDEIEAKLGLINETKALIQPSVDKDTDAQNAMNLLNEIEGMVLEEQQIKIGLQKVNESEDFKIIDFLTDKDGYQKDVMVNLGIDEENYDEFVESVKTQHLQSEIDMYVGDHSKEEIEAITSENYETKLDLEPGIYSWTEVETQLDSFSENSDLIDMRVGISQQSIDGIGNAVAEAIKSGARNGFNSQEVEDAAQDFQDLFNNPDAKDGNIQTVKYILETENMTPEEFLALRKEGHDSQAKTLLKYGIEVDTPDWFLTLQTMKEQTAEYKILTAVENNDMRLDDLIKLSETNEQAFKVAVNAESDEESKEILETIKQMSDKEYDLKVAINQESINSIGTAVENAVSNIEISVDEKDVTEATTAVGTLKTTIEETKKEASDPINVEESGAEDSKQRVEGLDGAIDELKKLDPTSINVGVDPSIYGDIASVHSLQGAIDSLEGKTVTITTVYDTYHNDYHNAEAAAASGTLTSIATAYADGTIDKNGRVTKSGSAYNVANYKNAYAKGDVALGEDQDALTNELGTESIVFLCDFMW